MHSLENQEYEYKQPRDASPVVWIVKIVIAGLCFGLVFVLPPEEGELYHVLEPHLGHWGVFAIMFALVVITIYVLSPTEKEHKKGEER